MNDDGRDGQDDQGPQGEGQGNSPASPAAGAARHAGSRRAAITPATRPTPSPTATAAAASLASIQAHANAIGEEPDAALVAHFSAIAQRRSPRQRRSSRRPDAAAAVSVRQRLYPLTILDFPIDSGSRTAAKISTSLVPLYWIHNYITSNAFPTTYEPGMCSFCTRIG